MKTITKKATALLLLLLLKTGVQAQNPIPIQELIESIAENLTEDYDLSELTERFNEFQKHPIDLNHTTTEQLQALLLLSPLQIGNLLDHIHKNGKLIDLLELQAINGLDLHSISRILPFVCLRSTASISDFDLKKMAKQGNHDFLIRYGRILQTQKGFRSLPGSRYLGSPDKLLMRYKYRYADRISVALLGEKDAGESFLSNKTGLDHLSGNITLLKLAALKKVVVGDYSLQFGQGLALSSGFGLGKGAEITTVAARELGLQAYAAANESIFFRGIGTTIAISPQLELNTFISSRKLDASLKDAEPGESTLQNINVSGLHRTATERKNQKSLGHTVYGSALQYHMKDLRLGILGYQSRYQHRFIRGNQLYNQYSFQGKTLNNTSFYYSYTWHNLYLFGETAHSLSSGFAMVNGAMAALTSRFSVGLVHRDYQKNYHTFYGNGLSEGSEINNENGWYTSLNYTLDKRWAFSIYADYFQFPWARYRVDSASSGKEWFTQMIYTPNKKSRLLFRYKRELKSQNPDAGSKATHLQRVKKESYRCDANWELNRKLNFQQRLEITHYQKDIQDEWGYLIYSDLNYKPLSSRISGNMRIAYFQTPSYNSRIYAYEDDVLYASGFGIYYGNGVRNFLNLRYRLTKGLDVFAKHSLSLYSGVEHVGSGLDEISGNLKSDFKLQMHYQF